MKLLINQATLDINSEEIMIKKYHYLHKLIFVENKKPTESLVDYIYNKYICIGDKKELIFIDHLFNIIICKENEEPIWNTFNNTDKLMNLYYHGNFKTHNLTEQYLKYRNPNLKYRNPKNRKNREISTSFLMLTKNNIALKNLDKQIKQKKLYDILQG